MSLESSIAELVSRTNALLNEYSNEKAAIDAALAAAIGGVGLASKTVWVDPVGGNDANTGLTAAAAFLTLDRAIEATANTSVVYVNLLGDVVMQKRVATAARSLSLKGTDAADVSTVTRNVSFAALASNSPDAKGATFSAGIDFSSVSALRTEAVNWAIPNVAGPLSQYNVIGFQFGGAVVMKGGSILATNSGTLSTLIAPWYSSAIDFWLTTVSISSNARGHILADVAANADPNTKVNYRSNITAL